MNCSIPVAKPDIGQDEINYVTEAVRSGWVSSRGSFIDEFEKKFANYIGVRHAIATCNGTAAIHIALTALGVTRGDEVLLPSLSFIAPANTISYTGASPIFVDSNRDYWCVDPDDLNRKISSRTKAIIPVHLYGHPCDMDPIMEIAREHELYVVEDCAEAHGAEYKGKRLGCFGDVSCFSFYGNKIITTGEGGICLTNNAELAEKIRILRDHGMNPKKRYWHDVIGFNYRMTNIQAALGVAQLAKIDTFVQRKREIAKTYRELLGQTEEILHAPEMPWGKNSYWLYCILLNAEVRDEVMTYLYHEGIDTRPFFYPIHTLPPYNCGSKLHVAEQLSARGLNLPSGPSITENELHNVASSIRRALGTS